jgi:hypothetical protein
LLLTTGTIDIIAGEKNLKLRDKLNNIGHIRKVLNTFIKKGGSGHCRGHVNNLSYDKRVFVPFVDERDHLGRIINNVINEVLIISIMFRNHNVNNKYCL